MKKIILLSIILLSFPFLSSARENADYWYIKNFETRIELHRDSTAKIIEEIIADCGKAQNKHGIFRILPTKLKTKEKTLKTPVELLSITDFQGNPIPYKTIKSSDTVTWKIGDPNKTVQGVNNYRIIYEVANVFRTDNPNFDELYYNLLGPFWDLEIDNFSAEVVFPEEINKENTEIEYYAGTLNERGKLLASYRWKDKNTLLFYSTKTIPKKNGITLSATFPKNIVTPYRFSFWEKYGRFFWLIIPVLIFLFSFWLWKLYGKEFETKKTVVPEFEIPENMHPVEMGLLYRNGSLGPEVITSSIIYMAVKGIIKIKESKKKILFLELKDYKLIKTEKKPENEYDKKVLRKIFNYKKEIKVSELKKRNNALRIKKLKKDILDIFRRKGLITKQGRTLKVVFIITAIALIFFNVYFLSGLIKFLSFLASALIMIIFAFFMPKRTKKGAELFWRIKGFKLYMKTAEKYRQQFYEKENIMDKLLPYAVVFKMTKEWIKKMEKIYGKDYYRTYAPSWYAGTIAGFDAKSFASSINSISSSISSNVSSGTGTGRTGGVGGGAGGGGGGGW